MESVDLNGLSRGQHVILTDMLRLWYINSVAEMKVLDPVLQVRVFCCLDNNIYVQST